jgi:alginate O-acetyltransferase complex protein AlgI
MATALTHTALPLYTLHRTAWLPALVLPAAGLGTFTRVPIWMLAWALTAALYAGFKWLTFARSTQARSATFSESLAYLLLWPGMDANAFLRPSRPGQQRSRPAWREWLMALLKLLTGLLLIFGLAPLTTSLPSLVTGWVGVVGLALVLLFGFAHLVSLIWRTLGVDAQPIMNRPLWATSLSDFWGGRWNLAFHDVGREFVFKPLLRRWGVLGATLGVFLFSGIVHEIPMSVATRQGLGLPTLYFLIQAAGVVIERSPVGKRFGLGRGLLGRAFAALVILAPVGLLFHHAFLTRVIIPTLKFVQAI